MLSNADEQTPGAASELGDLLLRSAAGDLEAFDLLYARTARRAFGLALRVVRDRTHAEDVTQEAYIKIWHTAAHFDPGRGNCPSWIFTIVHHVAIDHVRSTQSRAVRDERHHRQSARQDLVDADPTHDLARASLEASSAREAVAHLQPPQRQALELAYFDGHSYSEVARLLDLPLGTAKSRIRIGLIQLRRSLSPPDAVPVTP